MKKSPNFYLIFVLVSSCYLNCVSQKSFSTSFKKETIITLNQLLKENYVEEKLAIQVADAFNSLEQKGYFDKATTPEAFAKMLEEKAQEITKDKHLYFNAKKPKETKKSPPTASLPKESKAELLQNKIGYIYLSSFMIDNTTIDKLVEKVLSCNSLIIDLRENGGGDPNKVKYLSNYFFDKPTHLNTLYWREGNRYEEYWTKEILEKRLNEVPIFILTSSFTFSAAEEFTYNLQVRKRATIIGEQTGGGANPGRFQKVNASINAFIPEGKAINPLTKTNWSNGIVPDIVCSSEEALSIAQNKIMNN